MLNYEFGYNCQIRDLNEIFKNTFGYRTTGTFVEGGAYDGYNYSNTWGLAKLGWKGICYEPNPESYLKCVETYKDMPNITVIDSALDSFVGKANLFLGGTISTLKQSRVDIYNKLDWTIGYHKGETVEVNVTTLNYSLVKLFFPRNFDLLVLDVEGSEVEALKGFDIDFWKPTMVIVEACEKHYDPEMHDLTDEINAYFKKHKYLKIQAWVENNIYVKE